MHIKEIAARVSLITVAKHFNLPLRKSKHSLRTNCPACSGNGTLSMTPSKGVFQCFQCYTTGDSVMLYKLLKKLRNQHEAAVEMKETFANFKPEEYARKLIHDHPAVQALGIPAHIAQQLGIGYATKGLHRGRVVFALKNKNGTPVHFIGFNAEMTPQVKLPKFDPA